MAYPWNIQDASRVLSKLVVFAGHGRLMHLWNFSLHPTQSLKILLFEKISTQFSGE